MNNTCTREELEQVRLLFKDPGTQALFEEILSEKWIDIPEKPADDQQMENWKREFQNRPKAGEPEAHVLVIKRNYRYIKYAAAVLIICTVAALYTMHLNPYPQEQQIAMREISNPAGQRSKIVLPDSSVVFLGAASKLRFPEKFTGTTRELELEGEAFFEVVHKASQPLVVRSGEMQTRDLGTSFKIRAFKNQAYQVQVASGKVNLEQLVSKKAKSLTVLLPGEMAEWVNGKVKTNRIAIEEVKGWKDGRLVFNGTPLRALVIDIERFYGITVKFKNAHKAKVHVTTILTVADTPVEKIMNALSAAAHFKYTIKGKEILIN